MPSSGKPTSSDDTTLWPCRAIATGCPPSRESLTAVICVLRGPREGSILVFRFDSFDRFLEKAGIASVERGETAVKQGG